MRTDKSLVINSGNLFISYSKSFNLQQGGQELFLAST